MQENKKEIKRINSGIPGLDDVIEGGFEKDSTILLTGDAGTGKTTFGLQFLYNGAKNKEPGVFISFEEDKESIYKHALQYEWDFEKLEKENKFRFMSFHPHEVAKIASEGGGTIRDTIEEIGAKRIVIDSLTSYTLLFETKYKAREATLELFDLLGKWDCTAMVISEESISLENRQTTGMEFLTDAVIILYHTREDHVRSRSLEVLKIRGTEHSEKLIPFQFEDNGIIVYPNEELYRK